MRIGVTFPHTELGGNPDTVRTYASTVEGLGYTHIVAYDHVLGADPRTARGMVGALRRGHHLPRAPRPVRLPRRHHLPRAGHRDPDPAATTHGPRSEAGGGGRPALQWSAPIGGRARVERRRVRSPGSGLLHPGPTGRGAGPPAPAAVDRAQRDPSREIRAGHGSRHRPAAGAATDPGVVRGGVTAGPCPRRPPGRRLAAHVRGRSTIRPGTVDRRRSRPSGRPRPGQHRDRDAGHLGERGGPGGRADRRLAGRGGQPCEHQHDGRRVRLLAPSTSTPWSRSLRSPCQPGGPEGSLPVVGYDVVGYDVVSL